jgi:ubiquinone/menaquinone biosynthesis C-methylase UbiE
MEPTSIIREDFDRIALVSGDGWNHNTHYHRFLLRHVPPHCTTALEVGCGTGAFARLLAKRSERVLALDLSPQMIRIATERLAGYTNIDFQVADATAWTFPSEQFDCIVSIATMHHLPMETVLPRIETALGVGGTLIVLDLFQEEGLYDMLTSAVAVPVHVALKLIKNKRLREPRPVREVWANHGQHEAYLTLAQVRHICARILPGAQVRRHLLWRYSLIWHKTTAARRDECTA